MTTKSKAGMVNELTLEYDLIMGRAAQIKSAILMLQAIEPEEPKFRKTKLWRSNGDIKGVVLGNIPVTAVKKSAVVAKPKKKGKRKYTKKSTFWAKPHPRKK